MSLRQSFTFALLMLFSAQGISQQLSDQFAPEVGDSSIKRENAPSLAKEFMVVAAHPEASKAGYNVLNQGGNAIDAMVAVQMTLGLVEPQSSGLGGGAFLVYFDAKNQKLTTFDGRETAPVGAPDNLFLKPDQSPMQFFDAVVGGRSVGTPGTVKLLSDVHKRYGSMHWSDLLKPAIELADKGFRVTPRLANAVIRDEKNLKADPVAFKYFFPEGSPLTTGQTLRNPDYATTLNALAKHGGDYFYNSMISQSIIDKVSKHRNKGYLKQEDFSRYQVIEREPVCSEYRQFDICGMGPPSSGAIAVSQTLGILEPFELHKRDSTSAKTWSLIAEASRLAFADRGLYVADPGFVRVPPGLLDKTYLNKRSKLIKSDQAATKVSPGVFDKDLSANLSPGFSPEQPSTSHFVIVDKQGNIVSMTTTIENGFGSRLMVKGFLLNNELTDFSFRQTGSNGLIANRVEPGKRPRSSMAPTIVFKRGDKGLRVPHLALGSPGGSRIINFVTNSLIGILDWNMSVKEAFDQPHVVNRFGPMDIEAGTNAESFAKLFADMGYKTNIRDLNSGLHGIRFTSKGLEGVADYRREGLVLGR